MTEILIAAIIGASVALFIYFHGKRPSLAVTRAVPDTPAQFNERIEVRNHGQTTYSYRVRVGDTYLKFEKKGVSMSRITLPPGDAAGVILKDAINRLGHQDIVIECAGWLPWLDKVVIFRKRLEEIS